MFNLDNNYRFPYNRNAEEAEINDLIATSFKDSIESYVGNFLKIEPHLREICTETTPIFRPRVGIMVAGDISCGSTSLSSFKGSSIFCFHQGLASRNICIDIEKLTQTITHNLYISGFGNQRHQWIFDAYGLRRARSYFDIIDALRIGSIATCCFVGDNFHCVNIVGIYNDNFIVDDPKCGRSEKDIRKVLSAASIVWIW